MNLISDKLFVWYFPNRSNIEKFSFTFEILVQFYTEIPPPPPKKKGAKKCSYHHMLNHSAFCPHSPPPPPPKRTNTLSIEINNSETPFANMNN